MKVSIFEWVVGIWKRNLEIGKLCKGLLPSAPARGGFSLKGHALLS